MEYNHSPWIKQLKRERPVTPLGGNLEADVVIVGGGIAGISTAFFTLRDTDKKVILLEADKVAHGATGHNAGQITSYFERGLSSMVEEFGLDLAIDAQKSVESAWLLLDEIHSGASLNTPVHRFTGYSGYSTLEQLIIRLKNNFYRVQGGLTPHPLLVAEEFEELNNIPEEYKDSYEIVPQKDILSLLESENKDFIACISSQKGCMNSALFSEELLTYITEAYKDRFSFFEESPASKITLLKGGGVVSVLSHEIQASQIILCTNGFENFTIINKNGAEVDTSFHHSLNGRIGFMSGYVEPLDNPPTAISYNLKSKPTLDPTGETYFYLTRRPYEHIPGTAHNLVCVGGPEKVLPNDAVYSRKDEFLGNEKFKIEDFLQKNYSKYYEKEKVDSFFWHGLMGYTPNRIRRVGPEPKNPVLLYNLGCNGVGILPSIFGGKKISLFLNNQVSTPSLFDPRG